MEQKRNHSNGKNGRKFKNTVDSKANSFVTHIDKLLEICSIPISDIHLWDNYIKVLEILDEITLPCSDHSISPDRSESIPEFLHWLKQNDAKIDGVEIDLFPLYGLGLRATTDFSEGELILQIPRTLIFNVSTAASELNDLKSDILLHNMPQVALAIALLVEKSKDISFWKPYLNILPKTYNTILYMKKDDLILLKGSPTFEKSLKHCRSIVRQYAYFCKLFQNDVKPVCNLLKDRFTYEEYRWAVSTVMTRQNLIPNEYGSEMISSLIPMWDMCNHQEGKITTDFDLPSNNCKCYAMKDFRKFDQIFIYYGPRTNTEFFLHSGFVCSDNHSDNFQIKLSLSKSDTLFKKKANLLSKIGLPVNGEYVLQPGSNPLSEPLIKFLKIFCMEENQIDSYFSGNSLPNVINSKLGMTMEKKEFSFIVNRLKLHANSYVPKLENLEEMETVIQPSRKVIMQLRISEKKLIERLIEDLQSSHDIATYD